MNVVPELGPQPPYIRLSARMTSIDRSESEVSGDIVYVSTCAIQAQIALLHLDRIWAVEGDPPDVTVWEGAVDELRLWADIQGAMTASIILSRLLRPTDSVRAPSPLSKSESLRRSRERGERLRSMLGVGDESPLLHVQNVRHPLEHIDERLDGIVEDSQVSSMSDLYGLFTNEGVVG